MHDVERSTDCLFKIIFESVRLKLMGLNFRYTADVIKAAQIWNLPISRDEAYRNMIQDLSDDGD